MSLRFPSTHTQSQAQVQALSQDQPQRRSRSNSLTSSFKALKTRVRRLSNELFKSTAPTTSNRSISPSISTNDRSRTTSLESRGAQFELVTPSISANDSVQSFDVDDLVHTPLSPDFDVTPVVNVSEEQRQNLNGFNVTPTATATKDPLPTVHTRGKKKSGPRFFHEGESLVKSSNVFSAIRNGLSSSQLPQPGKRKLSISSPMQLAGREARRTSISASDALPSVPALTRSFSPPPMQSQQQQRQQQQQYQHQQRNTNVHPLIKLQMETNQATYPTYANSTAVEPPSHMSSITNKSRDSENERSRRGVQRNDPKSEKDKMNISGPIHLPNQRKLDRSPTVNGYPNSHPINSTPQSRSYTIPPASSTATRPLLDRSSKISRPQAGSSVPASELHNRSLSDDIILCTNKRYRDNRTPLMDVKNHAYTQSLSTPFIATKRPIPNFQPPQDWCAYKPAARSTTPNPRVASPPLRSNNDTPKPFMYSTSNIPRDVPPRSGVTPTPDSVSITRSNNNATPRPNLNNAIARLAISRTTNGNSSLPPKRSQMNGSTPTRSAAQIQLDRILDRQPSQHSDYADIDVSSADGQDISTSVAGSVSESISNGSLGKSLYTSASIEKPTLLLPNLKGKSSSRSKQSDWEGEMWREVQNRVESQMRKPGSRNWSRN